MICMNLNCTSARNDTYLHHIGRAHKFALSPDQTRSGVCASTRARQPACACRRVSISSISSGAAAVSVCVRARPDRATKSYFHDVSASAPIINYSLEPRGGSLSLRVHMHARATGKVLARARRSRLWAHRTGLEWRARDWLDVRVRRARALGPGPINTTTTSASA